ncbi:MAG: hypothetical protein BA873_10365 [Desulfobulbaceae bacterium C00003063]|nr:MAG: hypothetical protein BA873_10365 [Desulfobulbaceae bacterium C00003063]
MASFLHRAGSCNQSGAWGQIFALDDSFARQDLQDWQDFLFHHFPDESNEMQWPSAERDCVALTDMLA